MSLTGRDVAFCAYAIHADAVFVIPDAGADVRFAETERLRAASAAIREPLAVTASFGVCHSSVVTDPDAILEAADAALYRAKRSGRNRVVIADGSERT